MILQRLHQQRSRSADVLNAELPIRRDPIPARVVVDHIHLQIADHTFHTDHRLRIDQRDLINLVSRQLARVNERQFRTVQCQERSPVPVHAPRQNGDRAFNQQ